MSDLLSNILVPSVILAAVGLTLQGIKAIADLIHQSRTRKNAEESKKIQRIATIMQFIDGLPFDDGTKSSIKTTMLLSDLPDGLPENIKTEIRNLLYNQPRQQS